ncbi:phage tail tip fiber protein [Vibrio fluvialis]
MLEHRNIRFIVIKNPLLPDDRLFLEREYVPGKSLHDYIGDLKGSYAISKNGTIVKQEELKESIAESGDVVVICPIVHGGGNNSKNIMRLVAVVAITYLTAGYGATLAGSMGITSAAGVAAFNVALTVGGMMLVNAVLPPSTDDLLGSDSSNTSSYTYGIDGAKNTSSDNIPVPLVYGKHGFAGNIIGNYTELSGQTQYLNMLINAGEGVIAGIDEDSILINDQPISYLSERPSVKIYYGNDGQSIPEGFSRQVTPIQVTNNPELTDASTWTTFVTSSGVLIDGVQANFNTQLVRLDQSGNEQPYSVDIKLEIRKEGDADWVPLTSAVRAEDASRGYIFDLIDNDDGTRSRFNSSGKTVTKVTKGYQYIDSRFPNKYLSNGLFKNHYVQNGAVWEAEGDLVTDKGTTSVPVYYYDNQGSFGYSGRKIRNWTGAEPTLEVPPQAYAYGDLYYDGEKVGTFHEFHAANTLVQTYNGSGMDLGARAGQTIRLTGNSSSSNTRFSFSSPILSKGRYEIRARRLSNPSTDTNVLDQVVWNEVNEIQNVGIAYNYSALLALRIKVTDQISSIPKVTFEHQGRVIRVWDEDAKCWVPSANRSVLNTFSMTTREREKYGLFTPFTEDEKKETFTQVSGNSVPNAPAFSKPPHALAVENPNKYVNGFYQHANPAWIAFDILTATRFGAGIDPSRLDFYSFKKWAEFCESKNLQFRGVIDTKSNVWDCISQIFKVGRAVPLRMGTRYSVSIEKERAPVMRFGQDNIIKDSFSTNWLSMDDRANEIEYTFYDETNDYAARTIKISNTEAILKGAKPNTTSTTVRGVVTLDQATRDAIYSLNMNKLSQTVSFEAPVESLACTVGDVVIVQHNMMEWGVAGKLKSVLALGGDQYQLTLDQEFTFDSAQTWEMVLSLDSVSRGRFVVASKYGNYVTLTGFSPDDVDRVKRAIHNGVDMPILDTFKSSNGENGIIVDNAANISVGDAIELVDVDVLSNLTVEPFQYDSPTSIVTVTLPDAQPVQYQGFVIGYTNYESRLFSVRSIGLSGSTLTRRITALEYSPEALSDDNLNFEVTDTPAVRPLAPVSDVTIDESDQFGLTSQKVKLVLSWAHTDVRYKNASVSVKVAGDGIKYLGDFQSSAEFVAERDKMVEFIIVPRDFNDRTGLTTTVQHVPTGSGGNPYTVSNVSVLPITGGAKLSWDLLSGNLYATEIYAVAQGTLINGSPVELANPESWTADQILANANLVQTTLTTQYDHITETDQVVAVPHYYWLRTLDKTGTPSSFVYGGVSAPVTSRAFNTVTVYQWSVEAPEQPTGGSYEDPTPDGDLWVIQPRNLTSEDPENLKLWSSTRRFCNMEPYQDAEWSIPSAISKDSYQYTWIAYASDTSGSDFTLVRDNTSRFIGYAYNKTDPSPSSNYEDYAWQLLLIDEQPIIDVMDDSAEAALAAMLDTIYERDVTRRLAYSPETGFLARIDRADLAIVNQEKALAQVVEKLSASAGDSYAAIQEAMQAVADTNGVYQAQWGVKSAVNGLQGGIGFYNDGQTVQFVVNADTFAVTYKQDDGGEGVDIVSAVFSVVDGKTYINDAFINDAYITNLTANYINVNTLEALDIYGSTIRGSLIEATTLKGGSIEGTTIYGSVITGGAIQASYIAADVQMLVLTWANQEQYGSMSVEYLESQGITPYMGFNIGVSDSDTAVAGAYATLNIASYDNTDKTNYVRYSRRYVQPEGSSNTLRTFYESKDWYASEDLSFPTPVDNGVICKVMITHQGATQTITSGRLYDGQSQTVSGIQFNVSMTVVQDSEEGVYYGSPGFKSTACYHKFNINGSTVDYRGNMSALKVRYFINDVDVGGNLSDTAYNATTPTTGGPA